jgi:polysaccharide pyruvyl transferase CsaB
LHDKILPSMKVLIAGYYGFNNTGDEAILSEILKDLNAVLPNPDIHVISGNPSLTKKTNKVKAIIWTDIPGIIRRVKQCDLIILGGGGVFHDYWGVNKENILTQKQAIGIPSLNGILILAKLLNKPIVIYAVGVGPLLTKEGKEITRQCFELADFSIVRDDESKEVLFSIGVPVEKIVVTTDPAFSLPRDDIKARQAMKRRNIPIEKPLISVCLRNWEIGVSPEKWQIQVANALDGFIEQNDCSIVFIPFQNTPDQDFNNDNVVALAVTERMKNKDVAYILKDHYEPQVIAGLIAQCSMMLGMRLHSLVFAVNAHVPFVALVYDPKIANLMAHLGMQPYSLDIKEAESNKLLSILSLVWENRQEIRSKLTKKSVELMDLASTNKNLIIDFINHQVGLPVTQTKSANILNEFALKETLLLEKTEIEVEELKKIAIKVDNLTDKLGIEEKLNIQLSSRLYQNDLEIKTLTKANQILDDQLIAITQSKGWAILQTLWKLRLRIAPKGSKRENVINTILPNFNNKKSIILEEEKNFIPEKNINFNPDASRSGLKNILSRFNNRKVIVFTPTSLDWDAPLFQRPQQLAIAFAHLGCLVLFCEPVHTKLKSGFHQLGDGLFVCSVPMEIFEVIDQPIVISLSYNKEYIKFFDHPKIIYDYIDELEVFPFDLLKLKKDHQELCAIASVVVATSDRLYKQIVPLNSTSILCPNGVDYYHFHQETNNQQFSKIPDDLEAILALNKPIVGYYGIFAAEWIDYDLLAFAANKCPDLTFLLIGPDKDGSLQKSGVLLLPNIYWLGIRHYSMLPIYLSHFTIATIPFKLNKITHSSSPLKLFEYLAATKPVVITAMEESMRYSGSLSANNAIDYVAKIRQVLLLCSDANYLKQINQIALSNTWDIRAKQILAALDKSQQKKYSEKMDGNNQIQDEIEKMEQEDNSAPPLSGSELIEFENQVKQRDDLIVKLTADLSAIHHSNYWKALSKYWGMRNGIANQYHHLRNWLRRQIPHENRQKIVSILGKVGIQTSDAQRISTNSLSVYSKYSTDYSIPTFQPTKFDVICLPIIDWEFRHQRPQQIMNQFAKDGHRCFYIRQTFHPIGDEAIMNIISNAVFDVYLPGPADLNIYTGELSLETKNKFFMALDKIRIKANITEAVIIVDLPFWEPLAELLRKQWGCKIIYDCMDEHSGFSTNSNGMVQHENKLINGSDLVFAASRSLFDKCAKGSSRVIYLPNAADYKHFNQPEILKPILNIPKPIIGYYGAISEWFDVQLICSAAKNQPKWQFLLIGDTYGADVEKLVGLPNVHLTGEIPYEKLPGYLSMFDVACIPFKRVPLTEATNPVKFYEYLCQGKPVVAVDLPELKQYSQFYYPVKSSNEFEIQIENALNENSSVIIESRIDFAKTNTWQDRFKTIKKAICDIYQKVAIIVISYDNLEYLIKCLDSIWKKTNYPNYEVIVVDNGSKQDVIDYLEHEVNIEPKLKVIFNHENLGFAKANNIGIEASGNCDYLILLNNDTVVTNGWLSKLLHHFNDPSVKLVGPVTNWTANEARIDIDYTDLDSMDSFAQQYCITHQNRSFDIPMLTMFCVALPKSLINNIGNLDERFGLGMFEDDDFSLRVKQSGGRVICAEDVFIHHWGMVTFGKLDQPEYLRIFNENREKFEEKWGIHWQPHQLRSITKKSPDDLPGRL